MSAADTTLLRWFHCRIEVSLDDKTSIVGKLVSLDVEGNIVLQDAERNKTTKKGGVVRESTSLVFVRGSSIVRVAHIPGITTSATVVDHRI